MYLKGLFNYCINQSSFVRNYDDSLSLLLSSPIHFAHQWIEPWFTHYGELLHLKQIYSFGTLFSKYLCVGEIKGELKTKLTRDSTTIHRRNNQIICYFKQCKRIGGRDYFSTQIFIGKKITEVVVLKKDLMRVSSWISEI